MYVQIRTRAVSCKQMTMVTPIQLLLFASRTVKSDGEFVLLDSWLVQQICVYPLLTIAANTDDQLLNLLFLDVLH